jgi:hypothetical protein
MRCEKPMFMRASRTRFGEGFLTTENLSVFEGNISRSYEVMKTLLVEEFLVHLFNVQGLLDPATDVVANHQACELIAIDEYNSFA